MKNLYISPKEANLDYILILIIDNMFTRIGHCCKYHSPLSLVAPTLHTRNITNMYIYIYIGAVQLCKTTLNDYKMKGSSVSSLKTIRCWSGGWGRLCISDLTEKLVA